MPAADAILPFAQAFHVQYGPRTLLEDYFDRTIDTLQADGITLYLSRDVDRVTKLGADYEAAQPARFPGMDAGIAGFGPDSWFTLEGRDREWRLAFFAAARLLRLKTNFREELESFRLFYWDPHVQRGPEDHCEVSAPSAEAITHYAGLQGAFWVTPRLRGSRLIRIFPTLCRWSCFALWDVDHTVGFLHKDQAERGLARLYREPPPERWIRFRGRWADDSYMVVSSRRTIEADIADQADRARISRGYDELETKREPSAARQGSSSRS